ncbi:hypothetical protein B296_00028648 [Ensete ventricosum]|uniref:Uncharacterized protein n=1 Tax=Ensete ventricosum TaxID=4639 RepID=A0A426ZT99_ENSVE|nr:hypothetical protein B296_00028648 [Ensete ventricosum]
MIDVVAFSFFLSPPWLDLFSHLRVLPRVGVFFCYKKATARRDGRRLTPIDTMVDKLKQSLAAALVVSYAVIGEVVDTPSLQQPRTRGRSWSAWRSITASPTPSPPACSSSHGPNARGLNQSPPLLAPPLAARLAIAPPSSVNSTPPYHLSLLPCLLTFHPITASLAASTTLGAADTRRIQDLANKRTKLKTFTAFPWQTVAKVTGNGSGRRRACQDERVGGWAPATEHAGHGDLLRQRRDSHLREPKNRGSHVDGRVGRGGGGRARDDKGGGHAGALVGVHRFLVEEQQPEAVRSKILPGGRGRRGGSEGVVGDEVSSGGSGFRVEKGGVGVVPLLVEVNVGRHVTPTPSVEEKGTGWCTRG